MARRILDGVYFPPPSREAVEAARKSLEEIDKQSAVPPKNGVVRSPVPPKNGVVRDAVPPKSEVVRGSVPPKSWVVQGAYHPKVGRSSNIEEDEEDENRERKEDLAHVWAAFAAQAGIDNYEPSEKDVRLAEELLVSGFTLARIEAGIEEAFRRFRARRSRGRIKTFAYCVPIIREIAQTVPPEKSAPGMAKGVAPQAVSADEVCATAETGSPLPAAVAAHSPKGGPPPVPADGATEGTAEKAWEHRVRELAASMGLSNSDVLVLMRYAGRYDPAARKQGGTGMAWVCQALEKAAGRGADNPVMYVERVLEDWAEKAERAEQMAQAVQEVTAWMEHDAPSPPPSAGPESEAERLWQTALDELKLQVSPLAFKTWLVRTQGMELRDGTLVVAVPHEYTRDWLENRLRRTIERTLIGIVGRAIEVEFVVQQ